jgi:arylformamidase
MKIYDITVPIYEGMPVYKNKPEKQPIFATATNGHVTESRITLDAHTGTHIDAPLHMINDGETFDTIGLENLVGNVKVFDLSRVEDGISQADLEPLHIAEGDFILLKTRNSFSDEFQFDFIYLKADAAAYLAERKIKGIGIDALGIERSQEGHPTHKTLFGANIIVMEGLYLREVSAGTYFMVAAPLKVKGLDAAPARVMLLDGFQG